MIFYWDAWNRDHVIAHGIAREDAAHVVRTATAPFPEPVGSGKHCVWGATPGGRLIQVIFAFRSPEEMDYDVMSYDDIVRLEGRAGPYVYIIHARPLTSSEKSQLRKRRR